MGYTFITDHSSLNKSRLASFVQEHPHGNVFYLPEMLQIYENAEGHQPVFIACLDDENILQGLIAGVIQSSRLSFLRPFTARCIVWGGPLSKDNSKIVADSLLQELDKTISKKAIYIQFRNQYDTNTLLDNFISNGFFFEDHLNIIINLGKDIDVLWREVHSKRRNEIRKSIKEGTYFEETNSIEVIEPTYKILKEVYNKAKLPLPDLSFFIKVHQKLGPGIFKVFVAKFNHKIIGMMYTLCYKKTIYDWYAGSYSDYYNKYPNDLITWEVFLWGKRNGYKYFDFGGAGKPGVPYGVRDYKMKFGGALVNFGRYTKINNKSKMLLGETGLQALKLSASIKLKLNRK